MWQVSWELILNRNAYSDSQEHRLILSTCVVFMNGIIQGIFLVLASFVQYDV